jgi:hypothetical protein
MVLFDATVWGKHYWFFLHTVAHSYPIHPNAVTKRKYYDLITNFPLFIPDEKMGNRFAEMLDKYPVTPYLVSRDSFTRWVNFIHNKYNVLLGKPEVSYLEGVQSYFKKYEPKPILLSEKLKIHKRTIFIALFLVLFVLIYFLF